MLIAHHHRLVSACFAVAVLAVLTGACKSGPAVPPAPPPVSSDVWAVVDGREIKSEVVEKLYRRTAQAEPAPSDDEALTAKLNLLEQAITEDILLARGRELKIEVPEAELVAAYDEARKNVTEEAFTQELFRRNMTAADMRDGLRRDLLARKVIEREVAAKVSVTDQDIASFYEANRAQFNLPEDAYHIAQIVVTPVRDAGLNNRTGDDAATPQAATAKVQMLMERLKSGAQFSDVAMDFSEEPQSAPRGGDVGLLSASALSQAPPPLRNAVLKVKPGSVNVVSIDGGYTIVLLVAHEKAGQRDPSMPAVRERISGLLRGRREQLFRTAYLAATRNKVTVVNLLAERLVQSPGTVQTMTPAKP